MNFHALTDVFDKIPKGNDNVKFLEQAARELWDMDMRFYISIDGGDYGKWGKKENDVTLDYKNTPVSAKINPYGVEEIERILEKESTISVGQSVIKTNKTSRKIGIAAAGFALLTVVITGLQYFKKDPNKKELHNIQDRLQELQLKPTGIDTVYLINHQPVSTPSKKPLKKH